MEILLLWAVSAVIGYLLGMTKGKERPGLLLGLFLGPLGWLLVALLDDDRARCPMCKGALPKGKVMRCRHCGGDFEDFRRKQEYGAKVVATAAEQAAAAAAGAATQRRQRAAMDPVDLWEEEQCGGPPPLPLPVHLKKRIGVPPDQIS